MGQGSHTAGGGAGSGVGVGCRDDYFRGLVPPAAFEHEGTCLRSLFCKERPNTLFCMPSTIVTAEKLDCIKAGYADVVINRRFMTGQINNRDLQLIKEYLA
jgi:hypothetical protein